MLARARAAIQVLDAERSLEGRDLGPPVVFVVAALSLVFMEYSASPRVLSALLREAEALHPGFLYGPEGLLASRWYALVDIAFWAGTRILGFTLLPVLAIRFVLKQRVRDHGLRTGRLRAHATAYAAMFAIVLPPILLASLRPEFRSYYPFYRRAHESWFDLAAWEALYAAHFVALEFFFRGFWLTGTRRAFGHHAVYAMMVPYCMIHFTKPLLEVLGAIAAGIVLGLYAMRSRSIWGGAAVHVGVALTMDLCALLGGPGLPSRAWPS